MSSNTIKRDSFSCTNSDGTHKFKFENRGWAKKYAKRAQRKSGNDKGMGANSMIKTAVVYRTEAQKVVDESEKINYNDSDQVQFELCLFSDGRVAQRWLVGKGSCVWWDSLEDLYRVHIYAHPDYGTRVEWSNGEVEQL